MAFGANDERGLFLHGPSIDDRSADQSVGTRVERVELDLGLALVAGGGDLEGAQRGAGIARRGRPQFERDVDGSGGAVVGAQGAHAQGHRLAAPVFDFVEVDAQMGQRRITHQPANGAFPEALEGVPIVACAGRLKSPAPSAVGRQRQGPPLADLGNGEHRGRLAVAALLRGMDQQCARPRPQPGDAVDAHERGQGRPT